MSLVSQLVLACLGGFIGYHVMRLFVALLRELHFIIQREIVLTEAELITKGVW